MSLGQVMFPAITRARSILGVLTDTIDDVELSSTIGLLVNVFDLIPETLVQVEGTATFTVYTVPVGSGAYVVRGLLTTNPVGAAATDYASLIATRAGSDAVVTGWVNGTRGSDHMGQPMILSAGDKLYVGITSAAGATTFRATVGYFEFVN